MSEQQAWLFTFAYVGLAIVFSVAIGMIAYGIKTEWNGRRNSS